MFGRNKIAMVMAEFLGTFSLASAVLAMVGRTTFPFFSAVVAGATFGLMTLVIGITSGAHINPAVTIGLWANRKIEATRGAVYIAAQMLGGLVAWKLAEYLLNSPLQSTAGKFMWRVLVAETIGAFIFMFGMASAIYQNYKGLRYAAVVGSSLALGMLIASFGGNGLINPAIALAVRSWNLAYAIGPILGAIIGINLYAWLMAPTLNFDKVVAKISTARSTIKVIKKSQPTKLKKRH